MARASLRELELCRRIYEAARREIARDAQERGEVSPVLQISVGCRGQDVRELLIRIEVGTWTST